MPRITTSQVIKFHTETKRVDLIMIRVKMLRVRFFISSSARTSIDCSDQGKVLFNLENLHPGKPLYGGIRASPSLALVGEYAVDTMTYVFFCF